MLTRAYKTGVHEAYTKFALNPPTQVDTFIANVESGKDVPPDASTDVPPNAPPPPDVGLPPSEERLASVMFKFALPGSTYANALAAKALQTGGNVAPAVQRMIAAQPRARLVPGLSESARGGVRAPTPAQQDLHSTLEKAPWSAHGPGMDEGEHASYGHNVAPVNRLMQSTGRAFEAPGLKNQMDVDASNWQMGHDPTRNPNAPRRTPITSEQWAHLQRDDGGFASLREPMPPPMAPAAAARQNEGTAVIRHR